MTLPTAANRSKLDEAFGDLIDAIEAHDLWTLPKRSQTLYWIWDFVKRSKYMLSEFENIQHGRKLEHPDQFRPAPGTGDAAATAVFNDVCGRCSIIDLLVNDTTGKMTMLTMNPGPQVDFGIRCRDAVANLMRVSKEVSSKK